MITRQYNMFYINYIIHKYDRGIIKYYIDVKRFEQLLIFLLSDPHVPFYNF